MPDPSAEARWRARVGTTLKGKWTLERLLGAGGMAAVYAARHKIGRVDAVKILHPEVARSPELRARFEQEARAATRLGHRGAIEIRDVDAAEDGAPFLVMELLEGESLAQRAEREPMTHEALFPIADEVLDVLAAAHGAGIVHRDIKPDNVFLCADGRVKVLDFGIARMEDGRNLTRTGSMLGTVSYMSPEQLKGKGIDGRADLFSVGATLFRILARRRIHDASSEGDLAAKMATIPAPSLRQVAPAVDARAAAVVDRALAFAADARYPDARTMQADVRAVARGEEPPFATKVGADSGAPTARPGRGAAVVSPYADSSPAPAPPLALEPTAREAPRARDLAFEDTAQPAGPAVPAGQGVEAPPPASAPVAVRTEPPAAPAEAAPAVSLVPKTSPSPAPIARPREPTLRSAAAGPSADAGAVPLVPAPSRRAPPTAPGPPEAEPRPPASTLPDEAPARRTSRTPLILGGVAVIAAAIGAGVVALTSGAEPRSAASDGDDEPAAAPTSSAASASSSAAPRATPPPRPAPPRPTEPPRTTASAPKAPPASAPPRPSAAVRPAATPRPAVTAVRRP